MSADFWLTDLLISIRLRCVGQTRRLTYCIADDVMSTDFWLLTTGTEKHDLRNKVSWFQIKKGSQVCRGDVRFFFIWLALFLRSDFIYLLWQNSNWQKMQFTEWNVFCSMEFSFIMAWLENPGFMISFKWEYSEYIEWRQIFLIWVALFSILSKL